MQGQSLMRNTILGCTVVLGAMLLWWWHSHATAATAGAEQPLAQADAVAWERRWLTPLDPNVCTTDPQATTKHMLADAEGAFHVASGRVRLRVQPGSPRVQGEWVLEQVQAPWGWLHATLPPGLVLHRVTVGSASVAADVEHGHLAIALDVCAQQLCTVTLHFEVSPGAGSRIGTDGIWLRAADVLPRLGLDGDRLLRQPATRKAHGLSDFLTLPDYWASPAVAGVAPAAAWQWDVQIEGEPSPHGASGTTDGALDFAVAWMPVPQTDASATKPALPVLELAVPQHRSHSVAAELDALQACMARRMGGTARVERVAAWPVGSSDAGLAGYPQSQLSAATLWLPHELWPDAHGPDVPPDAQRHTARRTSMAQAIALRYMADTARLRQGRGVQWLAEGVPAALALACVAETEDPLAVQALLQRAAQQADAALQAQHDEVGAVAYAAFNGWVRQYAPLAALDSVRRLSADQINTLLHELRDGVRVQYALANALGVSRTTLALSMPLATDLRLQPDGSVTGDRWRWQQGQWSRVGTPRAAWPLAASARHGQTLYLDAWPGYERQPTDNLQTNRTQP
ncbi:hypothetical protein SAMN02745117_00537 [Lampropedia hyalina DSM 16112]|uniref:Uncharacterized protein n=2 Tax=Lampropedia TaxID=198705 RepID=A0A1M4UPP1_9BURK|nr:hypothetical protein SAMN02745117_00537 [Lampropedia hyalina DSM 16112]